MSDEGDRDETEPEAGTQGRATWPTEALAWFGPAASPGDRARPFDAEDSGADGVAADDTGVVAPGPVEPATEPFPPPPPRPPPPSPAVDTAPLANAGVLGPARPPNGGGRRHRASPLAPVLAAVSGALLVLAVGAAVVFFLRATDEADRADALAQIDEARTEAADVAARFGEALLTYDPEQLDESQQRVLDLSSEDFATTYREAFDASLAAAIRELDAVADGTTRDVLISDVVVDGDQARALVEVDTTISADTGDRSLTGSLLLLDLVREDGAWRIAAVVTVQPVDTPISPTPGPTTTVAAG